MEKRKKLQAKNHESLKNNCRKDCLKDGRYKIAQVAPENRRNPPLPGE